MSLKNIHPDKLKFAQTAASLLKSDVVERQDYEAAATFRDYEVTFHKQRTGKKHEIGVNTTPPYFRNEVLRESKADVYYYMCLILAAFQKNSYKKERYTALLRDIRLQYLNQR